MILFKRPEQLLEARHAVESVESDTVALKTLMFEIFWDAEVLGTFRALSKPSPPKHQVTLEQHRFASTLKWRYDDVICVDCKAWTRQSMPWSQDLKYTAIPVKLTFCWVLLVPMFLVVSGERKIGSWNLHGWVLASDSEWLDISTRLKNHPPGRAKQFILEHIDEELRAQSGLNCGTLLERMRFSVTVTVFSKHWNLMECIQHEVQPHVDKCWIVQLAAIRQPCEKKTKTGKASCWSEACEPSFVSKAESLGCDSRHVCLDLSVSRNSATTNYTFI